MKLYWNFANFADLYEEKINPQNPLYYLYEGEWESIKVEIETFNARMLLFRGYCKVTKRWPPASAGCLPRDRRSLPV